MSITTPESQVDGIIAYESGEMDFDQMIDFFQSLIDNGLAWKLQGHYGRTAEALIKKGYCHNRKVVKS